MRRAKFIVGTILLLWAGLLFLGSMGHNPQSTAITNRYVDIAVLLTPFLFVAIGLSLVLSARRTKKR